MDDYKTKMVEPEHDVAVMDASDSADQELAAKALEEIRSTECLSGFGRFATRLQNFFQGSKPQSRQGLSPLKMAPIMMSVGLLLLVATGLLFLLSKPESAVPSHFRQPAGLAGGDRPNTAANATTEPPATEDQLSGRDGSTNTAVSSSTSKGAVQSTATRHFSFGGDEPSYGSAPAQSGVERQANQLDTPATVFVDDPAANSGLRSDLSASASPRPGRQLPVGTQIVAHTTNAISSGLESPVIAVVDRTIQLGDTVVIPEGARVIGQTAGAAKDRVNVRFTSVVLPNESEMPISGLALMKDGSAGLVGKIKGKRNPVLSGAARIGTGAAVVATEFAGQGSLDQPFSQGDYLRNQMAAEVASQGTQLSNRWQQPMSTTIVAVDANQPITIFLLEPMTVSGKASRNALAMPQVSSAGIAAEESQPSDQALIAAQTTYIQALEAQLAEMKATSGRDLNAHQ